MPIILPSGVANAKGTPAIISDDVNIVSLPASDYAAGTLYIDYDRSVIYSNYQSSSWILIADVGGGGGGGTLQQVLDAGNQAFNQSIELYQDTYSNIINSSSVVINDTNLNFGTTIITGQIQFRGDNQNILKSSHSFSVITFIDNIAKTTSSLNSSQLNFYDTDQEFYSTYAQAYFNLYFRNQDKRITAAVNQDDPPTIKLLDTNEGEQLTIGNYYIEIKDVISSKIQTIYPSPNNYNDQLIFLPEDTGTIALQDPPYYDADVKLGNGSITPSIQKNSIIQVTGGDNSNSIILDSSVWKDKVTLTLCVQDTPCNFTLGQGSAIYGNTNINTTGLYYVTYLATTDSFYLSHT